MEVISAAKIGPKEVAKPSEMTCGMRIGKDGVGRAFGQRGQGPPLLAAPGRARAHKTLNLLQSAIGVFKNEGRVSRAPYIAGRREASDVLLPRQSPWEHGGGYIYIYICVNNVLTTALKYCYTQATELRR